MSIRKVVGTVVGMTVAASAASGCATYPAEGAEARQSARQIFGDVERLQFGKQVQVQLPTRISVLLEAHEPGWTSLLVDALEKDPGTYTAVEPLSFFDETQGRVAAQGQVEWLRQAASSQHADLLMVSEMTVDDRDSWNALTLLNVLVLPCFFLPTQRHEVGLRTRTAVLDVRNGLVYATTDDHRKEEFTSTASGEESDVRDAAGRMAAAAVEDLRPKLERKLRALEQKR